MNGAILAGGRSRRMGRDKALVEVNGRPMLERVARAALAALDEVVIVGRSAPDGWSLAGPRFVADEVPGQGPLGGLGTALRRLQTDLVLLACDLPALTTDAITWLLAQGLDDRHRDGVVAVNQGRLEPLFGIYRASALPLVEARLVGPDASLHGLIAAGDFGRVPVPAAMAPQLVNVNHPDDLVGLVEPGPSEPDHESG